MEQPDTEKKRAGFTIPLAVWFWLGIFWLNLLVYGLVYQRLQQSRHLYEQRAAVTAQNIVGLLEQSVADSIERVELGVLNVVDEAEKQLSSDGSISKPSIEAYINRLHSRFPDLEGIRITDESGTVRYGTHSSGRADVSIANDDHFIYLRTHPDAGTVISKPKFGKISNKWTIKVVRRYNRPGGAFAGVVSGIIDVNYYAVQFAALNVGEHGTVTLRDGDMGIIVRYPEPEAGGSSVGKRNISQRYQDMLLTSPYKGTFIGKSTNDGRQRTVSYRRLGKWPLLAQVALAEDDYLAEWRHETSNVLMAAAVFSLFSIQSGFLGLRYLSSRKRTIDALEENRNLFRTFAEMSADWFWEQDAEYRFTHISGKVRESFGVSEAGMVGKRRQDIAIDMDSAKMREHMAQLDARQPFKDFEYSYRMPTTGEIHVISASGIPVFDADGRFQGYRGFGRDVTENRRNEERIRHMAQYDSLTNLPNRALFYDRLEQAIIMARRNHAQFALLYLDLDKFKPVNDRYGHHAGDLLLQQVADRIRINLRDSDTIARLGGDEFAVLLQQLVHTQDAEEIAAKLIAAVDPPYTLENVMQPVTIGVSIGVAIYPDDASDKDGLIRAADAAMYLAKQVSGNTYRCYGRQPDWPSERIV
ncbi:MAG: diguanylate cyclase/phosphodiesterase with sensor(s) [Burkholderiaceae bacterium]|nr:diguanylate cyclase/phosphodiesterase with sensor(s) [Burkholderiaceae bacterium]